MYRIAVLLFVLTVGPMACTSSEPEPNETGTDTEVELPSLDGLPNGEFLLSISLAPAGGLVVPFQFIVLPGHSDEGLRVFKSVDVRVTNTDGELSDLLLSIVDVAIGEDGAFTFDVNLVVPGPFSPTASDVAIDSQLSGVLNASNFFCGDVTGEITTFELDLAGSSFGAVPWSDREAGGAASCDEDPNATLPRLALEDCPALVAGSNSDFPSAGNSRSFEVRLPAGYSEDSTWPLVFGWHGFGGTAQGFVSGDLESAAAVSEVILVAPQGMDSGGSTKFDPFSEEKRNQDVAFFDDLLTCVGGTFSIDMNRVYVTGMSNGGLMTGAIIARRSSVLAAGAPLSGGIGVAFAEDHVPVPSIVTWGGPEDFAFEQDFHLLSQNMIEALDGRDHEMVTCEHTLGHEIPAGSWTWVMEYLLGHTKGTLASPFSGGLTESFPAYCSVYSAE